ncbi:CubicO group peptidase, beta-lactamase class C family [Noviherbaspirillum humi]|uniref:CubicO group peptidase, beta-lactamase class C family n=1 Tax=Noviherbaspirillum humi TaxID=1688639 RepID=A0A239HDT5_9BURK|nr:serine hydrolase domain-containing protein [Noviherbaspirillum humi]SNS79295.1 CubicO group peptidase, beta-lactamase class C family [Noviherbaspirillum humi]
MNSRSLFSSSFSAARLDALTHKLSDDIKAGRIPGAVMLLERHGEIAYEVALGAQDPASGAPMTTDSIFRIYSMTKPIVSVAAMMLVEEGRLLLTDPISDYLPEFVRPRVGVESRDASGAPKLDLVEVERPITVHDLLRHTSGLTYGLFGSSMVKSAYQKAGIGVTRMPSDEYIRTLASLPLFCQPGTIWEYSHSTDVLGVLLERITGQSLEALLKERILDPLGMRDSGFWVEEEQLHRLAQAFDKDPVTGADVKLNYVGKRPVFFSGGGGMVSTARDYLQFARMLLNGGELDGERLLSRSTLNFMTSDHLGDLPLARTGPSYLPGPGYGFGLGFAVRTSAGNAVIPGSVGDYTWSGLAGTYFWIDPLEDIAAIFLMQAPEQRQHYRQLFRNMVYAALE